MDYNCRKENVELSNHPLEMEFVPTSLPVGTAGNSIIGSKYFTLENFASSETTLGCWYGDIKPVHRDTDDREHKGNIKNISKYISITPSSGECNRRILWGLIIVYEKASDQRIEQKVYHSQVYHIADPNFFYLENKNIM